MNIKIKDATPTRVGKTKQSSEITCAKFKASYKCCNDFVNIILPSVDDFNLGTCTPGDGIFLTKHVAAVCLYLIFCDWLV
jgi:hypothetical protein